MAINNMTYNNGKIYCIRNTADDSIYVGSTTQPLCKRMAEHRNIMKIHASRGNLHQKMFDVGVNILYIELIEDCPCDNKEELRTREGFFIRGMGTLNSYIAGRSRQDYSVDNRISIKTYKKQYDENHKTESIQYRKDNKALIKEQRSKLIICECGRQVTHQSKFRHIKTQIHQQLMNELSLSSSSTLND